MTDLRRDAGDPRHRHAADANAYGDIFGGWLMSQMDIGRRSGRRAPCARAGRSPIAMDGMQFHRPVKVGDEVSVYADDRASVGAHAR